MTASSSVPRAYTHQVGCAVKLPPATLEELEFNSGRDGSIPCNEPPVYIITSKLAGFPIQVFTCAGHRSAILAEFARRRIAKQAAIKAESSRAAVERMANASLRGLS